jgi:hypothetical protein
LGGGRGGDLGDRFVVGGGGHARRGACCTHRERTSIEGSHEVGQLVVAVRESGALACLAEGEAGVDRQPVLEGAEAVAAPALVIVELGEQADELALGGVDRGGQLADPGHPGEVVGALL